jgi:uroporphyrinogen-III synthase
MVPLVVIRPEPGCSASTAAARAARMEAHSFPLFEVAARSWEGVAAEGYDALLIGSANVFRHGGPALRALAALPVLAVGETTAEAARAAGFSVTATGSGGLQRLLDALPKDYRRVLRLAGDERIPLTVPGRLRMDERVVYASRPVPFPSELAALLRSPAIVALHSAEAARHLSAQCVSHAIRRAPLRLAALSPRIAAAAGDGWGEVAAAPLPDDKALLALARQMCQDPWPEARTNG